MKKTSYAVLDYLKKNQDKQSTASIIASALGMEVKSVNGIVTMSLARHKDENKEIVPLAERLDETLKIEYTDKDGNTKTKDEKIIVLTPEGVAFEPESIED